MKLYTSQSQANRLTHIGLPLRTADLFTNSKMLEEEHTPLFKEKDFWFAISAKLDDPVRDIFQLWSLGQLMFLYDKMFPGELMPPFNCVGPSNTSPGLSTADIVSIDPVEAMVRQFESHKVLSFDELSMLDLVNEDLPEELAPKIMATRKLNGVALNVQWYFNEHKQGLL